MRLIWDAEGKKYATRNPNSDIIEELVEELDNDTRTMVALDASGASCMMVIGGAGDRVRVNFVPEDISVPSSHLTDPEAEDDLVTLKMQRKGSRYHLAHTVTREQAVRALVKFVETMRPDPELSWQND